jgi:lipopolysaccharide biosynthesis protein
VTAGRNGNPEEVFREIRQIDPDADCRFVENRGLDVGAHWQHLDTIDLRSHDLALFLHSKKSQRTLVGHVWRKNLFGALLGTPDRWRDNLWAFAEDPRLGMIGSGLHRNSFDRWDYEEMRQVVEALEMPTSFDVLKGCYESVSGTMFLMRADLLAEMHAKTRDKLVFEPYESLSLHKRVVDGSLAHAMERAFGMYVRWRGFKILWRP